MAKKISPAKKKAAKPVSKKAAPKKAAAKKAKSDSGGKSETGIKYSDKSAGQPELIPIFEKLKKLLLPYEKGSIVKRGGEGGQIIMVSERPFEFQGRKRPELWFAAALVQKGYVGFYFMPVYTKPEMKQVFEPELLKCLKGKSCFHIKKGDADLFRQIKEALAKGYIQYKERGWID